MPKAEKQQVKIVILQRGWVFVGYHSRDGERCTLSKARCIRRWGTKKGLGELVNGPLENTVLDPAGEVEYHALAEVASLTANPEKWNAALE